MAAIKSKKKNRLTSRIFTYVLLTALAVIFLFPIFMILSMSLFSESDILEIPRKLIPSSFNISNFVDLFKVAGYKIDDYGNEGLPFMLLYLFNSIEVVILYVIGCVFTSAMAAFAFAKIKFTFRDKIFFVMLATMMIPGSVTMIPLYRIYKTFGMIDTKLPLWLPIWFGGGGANIFFLRQYMKSLPNEILESASIDGAGFIRKFFQIVIPNSIPGLCYIALTAALSVWNDFQTPLLYVYQRESWTLARGIAAMVTTNGSVGYVTTQHFMFAACVLMSLFPLGLFIAGQKFFIENVTISGMKV